ncbi:transporter substrate-binding domain-containing protein [Pontibacillus marinus]|uniref:Amino acid ABC transporter substrate-binding protein n=1 Tax=Pontibacillus marinus BH030004 = DSM 16465 TaxID=1385511 RepID=A0A0A5GA54_9BACI|nr:transporter substrate-binding domain-containing protein [Pontibacillus marinus]KGX90031.1 amino acid ABC transporter substrate-binding protein [Pontibacillus marinus BH030004 = DSM 16465]
MKKLLLMIVSSILLVMMAACGSDDTSNGDASSSDYTLVEDGKLTFASSGEYPPFSKTDASGEMSGYDIEVGNAIAEELGLEPNQQKLKFASIVEGVKSGRVDAAVASHTINEKRLKKVDFSTPYYYSGAQVFTRPGSDFESLEDLEGKEIAVSKGSTYSTYAEEVSDNVVTYDSDVVALQSLSKGRHDAVITDFLTGKEAIKNGLDIKGKKMIDRSEQAVAVSKENEKLLEDINAALETLRENGTLKKLSEKYFGSDITTKPE